MRELVLRALPLKTLGRLSFGRVWVSKSSMGELSQYSKFKECPSMTTPWSLPRAALADETEGKRAYPNPACLPVDESMGRWTLAEKR